MVDIFIHFFVGLIRLGNRDTPHKRETLCFHCITKFQCQANSFSCHCGVRRVTEKSEVNIWPIIGVRGSKSNGTPRFWPQQTCQQRKDTNFGKVKFVFFQVIHGAAGQRHKLNIGETVLGPKNTCVITLLWKFRRDSAYEARCFIVKRWTADKKRKNKSGHAEDASSKKKVFEELKGAFQRGRCQVSQWCNDRNLPRDWNGYVITLYGKTSGPSFQLMKGPIKEERTNSDPTPGRSRTTSIPCSSKWWRGPIPLSATISSLHSSVKNVFEGKAWRDARPEHQDLWWANSAWTNNNFSIHFDRKDGLRFRVSVLKVDPFGTMLLLIAREFDLRHCYPSAYCQVPFPLERRLSGKKCFHSRHPLLLLVDRWIQTGYPVAKCVWRIRIIDETKSHGYGAFLKSEKRLATVLTRYRNKSKHNLRMVYFEWRAEIRKNLIDPWACKLSFVVDNLSAPIPAPDCPRYLDLGRSSVVSAFTK